MSALREISANVGAFATLKCFNFESTGALISNTIECNNLVSSNVTAATIECSALTISGAVTAAAIECSSLTSSGGVSGTTLTGDAVVCSGNISADSLDVETKVATNQFQLIPAVPSLGYTLTSSDNAGNATWTAPLSDYLSYTQTTPKIDFLNSPSPSSTAPDVVVSSDGLMIVAVYKLTGGLQTQFQTFLYTSGAWVLDSTVTTPLTNNVNYSIALSDENDLLAVANISANQVVVYRRTSGAWVQVGDMLDLTGTYSLFGRKLVINSGKQTLAVLVPASGVVFYLIGASTLTLLGLLTIPYIPSGQTGLDISLDFLTLVTGNSYVNTNTGQVLVYVRSALSPLTSWTLSQTLNPLSTKVANMGTNVSISRDGSTMIAACPGDQLNAPSTLTSTGAVLVYDYVAGVGYVQGQKIIPMDYSFDSTIAIQFGLDLQLNFAGDTFVTGGYFDQGQLGSTWVYVRNERGLWIENGNKLRGNDLTSATAQQGINVAFARETASVVASCVTRDTAANVNAMVIFQ